MKYTVDTHTHTVASTHAYSTIHDYLPIAKAKGIKLFATTDHGPDMADAPHYWHFVNLHVLPRVVDGVGILRGIEANIKNIDGEIDFPERYESRLDMIMAGFHEPVFPLRSGDPYPGHDQRHSKWSGRHDKPPPAIPPSHRYPGGGQGSGRVSSGAGGQQLLVQSPRAGSESNCRAIVEAARDLGAYLTFGSDSHVAFSLGDFDHCHRLVTEANFPHERILARSPRTARFSREPRPCSHPGVH